MNFSEIDILHWGNEITIKGVVMEDISGRDILVLLPSEKMQSNHKTDLELMEPSTEEWFALQDQLDKCNVAGEEGILLRKSQRQLDQKICWQVYRRDKYACRYCGIDNVPLTVDHIITWETGGATHESNLLTACKKCNRKRGNLDYGSWLEHKYYIEKSKFLSEKIKLENESIVRKLNSLPRMSKLRSR